ncbi:MULTISPECIES: ABC transporter substrate-binding protein [Microbacterium]|uniref:Bacterial extracellular solute-binding protein n=1 Tax=Microbacterium trichothecenolyticum TaxID=69370 RepID=A0A0M2HFB1_MICTR|nr:MULTISPECIES: ABC transporter substrate-binding protein [Microbacterium]KJL42932.1 Bacterial extracellular solute-binding protein [Microbacterium trichothecenolyticum]MDR7187762.1 raffinose/stachyose/melibiose transport system substrate-binding protein [Microbacterium sp. BE35]
MPQHSRIRHLRWSLLAIPAAGALVLAGCSGSTDGGDSSADPDTVGFSLMVAQANDADDFYAQTAQKYTEETGVPIEVIPYPSDAYNTQVTTQLQAGNAADMMVLAPGTGQPISVITLADAGFLEPLDDTAAGLLPAGSEAEFQIDGKTYAQPTALTPVGMVFNVTAADEAGVTEYPSTYEDLLAACADAREAGKSFTVLAGGVSFNTGLISMLISATRVYAQTPDWNEQRAAGDVTFADSGWKDVLDDIVEMNDKGCFQDGAAGGTFDSITQGMGGGTSLTAAVPGSAAASIGDATGAELNVQAFPPADGEKAFTVTGANYAWGINAASDDAVKASAQAFLDWVAQPENAKAYADLSGSVPITGIDTETLLPEYAPIGDLLANGDYAGLPNATWPNPAVYDALGVGVQGLLTGQKTVDQVLADMDAAWDQ